MHYILRGPLPPTFGWPVILPTEERVAQISIGDFVALRFQGPNESEETAIEEMAVEIVSITKAKEPWAIMFEGKIVDDFRWFKLPGLKSGQKVNFRADKIYSLLFWKNSRTGRRLWRTVPREHTNAQLCDWWGGDLPKSRLDLLRPGNVVRVAVQLDEECGWQKLYLEITKIDYYTQGGVHRPRKFHGFVRDYYMIEASLFVRIGEQFEFQRRDIIEIPEEFRSKYSPFQPNGEIIERELQRRERIANREYYSSLDEF